MSIKKLEPIYKDVYKHIVENEISKKALKRIRADTSIPVRCCKCGNSRTTLYKINNEYYCKRCKEEL